MFILSESNVQKVGDTMEERTAAIATALEDLIIEHLSTVPDDETLFAIAERVESTWKDISADDLGRILAEEGIEDADESSVFNLFEDLYNKLEFSDLEE